jgi:hypothetical protein
MNVMAAAKYKRPREKTHIATFTIDTENNITAHAALPAGANESQSFSTVKELTKLTAAWPVSRLVDTWNSFEAGKEVHQPQGAVARIWQAVARLFRTVRNRRATWQPTKRKANKPTDGNLGQSWYLNGKRHRIDGPAAEYADGQKQ